MLQANMAAHGMPVTVTVPGEDPVETTGVWMTPETTDVPGGAQELRFKEGVQVLVLRREDVASVPRKTIVQGAPHYGATARWMVDGTAKVEADRVYVVLVPAGE